MSRSTPVFSHPEVELVTTTVPMWRSSATSRWPWRPVFLLFAGAIRRIGVYAAWGVVMAAIVIDDMLQLHERVGEVLVREFDLPAIGGLRPQDSGELAVWGELAGVLGIGLLIAHIRAPAPRAGTPGCSSAPLPSSWLSVSSSTSCSSSSRRDPRCR
ncbi:hypothetical protein QP028_07285 [Corynebacterium suedekumii]|nr:hypothetical protein QP028_07285 [Corynebacterium suedekumii]